MPFTREQHTAIKTHLLRTVLGQNPDQPVEQALHQNGYDTVHDIMTMTRNDIQGLQYGVTNDNNTVTSHLLNGGQRGKITTLQDFITATARQKGSALDHTEYLALTQQQYDNFRTDPNYMPIAQTGIAPPAPRPPPGTGITSNNVRDPVSEFKRGIKRDLSLFPKLKSDKGWDAWNRTVVNQARMQDVQEVLDHTYVPSTPALSDLFTEKQKFMYAVFDVTLLTDQGKAYVRQFTDTFDAQQVYHHMCKYSTRSTKATMDSSELLQYVTSVRLGDGQWRGTTHAFILNWQDQIRKYHDLVESTDRFPDSLLRIMLETSVQSIPDLHNVKTQAAQIQTSTGNVIKYTEYTELLLSAAAAYDKQFEPSHKRNLKGAKRVVYKHEQLDSYHTEDTLYNIDSQPYSLEVNFINHGPSLTKPQWDRLPPEAQTIWDSLTPDAKATILEPRPPRPPRHVAKLPGINPSPNSVNLHKISVHDHIQANLHEQSHDTMHTFHDSDKIETAKSTPTSSITTQPNNDADTLLAYLTQRGNNHNNSKAVTLPPAHLSRMMSNSLWKGTTSSNNTNQQKHNNTEANEMLIDGKRWRQINTLKIKAVYSVSASRTTRPGALIDRGANGGVAGNDVRIIAKLHQSVDVQGIDNHQVVDIPIVIAGGVINTQRGPAIAIMNQYAHIRKGKTIHSAAQLEWFGQDVNDRSVKVKQGKQRIFTLDGYAIPINIRNGLPYIAMRPYTDKEWEDLPHVILTSNAEWDPTVMDHDLDDDKQWFDAMSDLPNGILDKLFDEQGDYRHCTIVNHASTLDHNLQANDQLEHYIIPTEHFLLEAYERETTPHEPDYEALRPNFGRQSKEIVKRSLAATTQYARIPMSSHLRKHYKSPNPAMNIHRRDESVSTDTVYADVPAIDDGSTCAQFFVGHESQACDVYGMKTDSQFVNTLQDNIRRRGAPLRLISDRAQSEIGSKVLDILRAMVVGSRQSEPHHQHQNPSERKYQQVKRLANVLLDRTGSPAYTWLLALMYVCFLLNHTATASLNYQTPMGILTGSTPDCSPLLRFHWWEEVYFRLDDSSFPSELPELKGHFVGISEHVGHAMTFKILSVNTLKVLHRGNVRSAKNTIDINIQADELGGKTATEIIKSRHKTTRQVRFQVDDEDDSNHDLDGDATTRVKEETDTDPAPTDTGETGNPHMPHFSPHDLIGRTFLLDPKEDGQRYRARIVRAINEHRDQLEHQPDRVKYILSINDDEFKDIMSYNDIRNYIEKESKDSTVWKFRRIVAHEGPLKPSHPNWKGSSTNVMVEWENGEITTEPLGIVGTDDPVTCAIYASENDLLDQPGWKCFKSIARRQKKLFRMANQAKLRSFRTTPKYMYGFEVPKTWDDAIRLDTQNNNTKWADSIQLEMIQLHKYETFINLGKDGIPKLGFKKIRVHLVFAVKYDGRHKSRLVADGHLTDIPVDSVYSGIVSLRGLRMLLFLAELNNLHTWATDIGNAYLEATTSEKVYITAGPEFKQLEGHTLVIYKALYGLRSSGLRWHERFSIVLRSAGFSPCKMEPDLWLRRNDDVYEYIAVYVDDLAFAMKDPSILVTLLTDVHNFKLKGTGPIEFHLGCDFFCNSDGILCMAPRKYIDKMVAGYEHMFGEKPRNNVYSPLEKGDHPEIDTSELLESKEIQMYQSLVGSMQWAVLIGRLDIATATMTLSGFCSVPHKGHLERAKRIIGYLSRMKHAIIRFRVHEPDYSDLPEVEYDWAKSIYGDVQEELPTDAPTPLGNFVTLTHYLDANLYHDMLTGRSVTGVLHFLNQTPLDWFSKKQGSVETATYGLEFMASRTCVEQTFDIRNTLRYLGVPIREKSFMFGDNEAVVNSANKFDAKLHKRHTALSFHRV